VTAPFGRRRLEVAELRRVGPYAVLELADPGAPEPEPGQFAMLAAAERWGGGEDERPFLPRAFSYLGAGDGRVRFMLEGVGPGTARLAELRPGDEAWLTGPLGIGFAPPADGRRPVLCGGGVGIPPLAFWRERLPGAVALAGFRDGAHAAGAELMGAPAPRLATDDGSAGHHGFVTELLEAELDADGHATVYACGPPPMLETVRALCAARGVPAQLAMEAGMACGFGACFGCVVPTTEGYLRLCVDGPVVDAGRLETALVGDGIE
jgi:NAD(P)H-flavin reductase